MCLGNTAASPNLRPWGTHSSVQELLIWQFWEQICYLALTHHSPRDHAQIHRSFLLFQLSASKATVSRWEKTVGLQGQHNDPMLPTITTHYWSGGVKFTAGLFCLISGTAVSDINYHWHCRAKFSSQALSRSVGDYGDTTWYVYLCEARSLPQSCARCSHSCRKLFICPRDLAEVLGDGKIMFLLRISSLKLEILHHQLKCILNSIRKPSTDTAELCNPNISFMVCSLKEFILVS